MKKEEEYFNSSVSKHISHSRPFGLFMSRDGGRHKYIILNTELNTKLIRKENREGKTGRKEKLGENKKWSKLNKLILCLFKLNLFVSQYYIATKNLKIMYTFFLYFILFYTFQGEIKYNKIIFLIIFVLFPGFKGSLKLLQYHQHQKKKKKRKGEEESLTQIKQYLRKMHGDILPNICSDIYMFQEF